MRGFGTCYRHKGTRFWWIQYFRDGKRFRESSNSEKLKDAQDLLKIRNAQVASGAPSVRGLTVADLYDPLERDYTINRRHTLIDLRSRWNNHLSKFFADEPAGALSTDRVNEYIALRQADGAANASINRELAALKRMYKLAMKARKIAIAPYIEMLKERNVRTGFVKDKEYEALAQATAEVGPWLRAMFEVAHTYGWRKGELLGMRVRQIDLIERSISLNPGETKNEQGRQVEMTARVYELLASCAAGKSADAYLFTREKDRLGRRVKTGGRVASFSDDWKQATEAAGVPGLLFHDLRRSAVRNMLRDGVPEEQAMLVSGHKTRSAFQRYNIVDQARMRETFRKMERGAVARGRQARQAELFEESLPFGPSDPPRKAAAADPGDRPRTVTASPMAKPN